MVDRRNCSFCGEPIEPGTGKMYVKKDGTVYNFCTNKCKKNMIDIGRVPRRTRWTTRYAELKASVLGRTRANKPEPAEEPEGEPEGEKPKASKPKKPKKTGKPVKTGKDGE